MVVDLTYTDAGHKRVGILRKFEADIEFGSKDASNDYVLTVPMDFSLELKALIYIDGTEYGGVVDGTGIDYSDEIPKKTYTGRTWHGILARKIILPEGENYTVSGDANACIQAVINRVGDSDSLFKVASEASGIKVTNYKFERFCDAYTGLVNMLKSVGARLSIVRKNGYTWLSAVQAEPTTVVAASTPEFKGSYNSRPVNHLVCAGEGENNERVLVHLYADKDGNVSSKQSLFGLDEVAELYSFTSADADQITEDGTDKLKDYQDATEASMDVPEGEAKTIGDQVVCYDANTGFRASAEVEIVNVTIDKDGITIKPSLGEAQAAATSSYSGKGINYDN